MRVRTFFGAGDGSGFSSAKVDDTKPFDPKVVVYEIYGEPGATADVNYLDLDAQPQRIDGVSLPWTLRLESTAPSVFPNIVAQGNGSTISCRITVDDELKDERTSNGVNAQTFCLVKSA
ncbi:MmpS5 protein [Mycolicibacterium fortuitum subsp. fortuitum DSM 46621 = ATCC 6841 = JCM 6387]|uniref:MmpS5 protein n=4 Tax=Mycolicibacterium fortuitum TaxID=1766 RepID=K0V2W3_MYCFO|nr:MmpS5 protein [Mycolicibacterium fortuitum subsp. fortuitum DSM 46621 = ATCC 6841 = JCM 6387]